MLPQDRQSQAAVIRDQLRHRGWTVVAVERPFEHEWWAAEIWLLRSLWSPTDARLHLVFLTDPMDASNVWAVGVSPDRPADRTRVAPVLRLGHGWADRLPPFLADLSKFRKRRA